MIVSPARRAFVALGLAALVPALGYPQGAAPELRAITPDAGARTEDIVRALLQRFPRTVTSADPARLAARKGPAVYLAIGPAALRSALAAGLSEPLIALFISAQEYHRIAGAEPARPHVTAIYAEASPLSQMQVAARLYRRRIVVAALQTEATASLAPILQAAAKTAGVDTSIEPVAAGEDITLALVRAAPFDALVAFPDRTLYTPANVRTLLESTYRRGQGVVGFSAALVKAGMLAAPIATIEDTLDHLQDMVQGIAASGRVPEPQYPRYWRVTINDSVARSLGLAIDEADRAFGRRPPESP